MQASRISPWSGWRLTGRIAFVLLAMAAVVAAAAPDGAAAALAVVRLTARTSVVLFMIVFATSGLAVLAPSSATRWLRRNRRYLGVSFAISHAIHLAGIIAFARLDPAGFAEATNVLTFLGGGLAYGFIAAMALTSFDRAVVWLGPRRWRLLHTLGLWYIWVIFAQAYGKRVVVDIDYGPGMALVLAALVVRLLPRLRKAKA